jgi:hypothetical protein
MRPNQAYSGTSAERLASVDLAAERLEPCADGVLVWGPAKAAGRFGVLAALAAWLALEVSQISRRMSCFAT